MFSEDLECQKLLMEAMKYHLLPERRPMFQSPRTKPRKSTVGALYAVGGMDATKGSLAVYYTYQSMCSNTVYLTCNTCCFPGFRLHYHREVWSADEHMGTGRSHERTATSVWRGCNRKQTVCGWRERWTQDFQHGGVLQSYQQSVVHHAPHVNSQTWTWWVHLDRHLQFHSLHQQKCKEIIHL